LFLLGVFEVDDDDDEVEEMMLAPMEQLAYRLGKLRDAIVAGVSETKGIIFICCPHYTNNNGRELLLRASQK